MKNECTIHTCKSKDDYEIAKVITKDYMQWLGMDLDFQNTDKEFQVFETMYGEPEGCFIYATKENVVIGGVACRKLGPGICEMKRLFVYESYQGNGVGRVLCDELIKISKELGYNKMRLDTISKLESAIALYEKIGFYEISAYYPNPDATVKYMELDL